MPPKPAEPADAYDVLALRCRHFAALLDGQDGWLNAFTEAADEAYASEEEIPGWVDKQAQRVLAAQACSNLAEKTIGWVVGGIVSRLEEGIEIGDIEAEVAKRGADLPSAARDAAIEQVDAKRALEESQRRLDALASK